MKRAWLAMLLALHACAPEGSDGLDAPADGFGGESTSQGDATGRTAQDVSDPADTVETADPGAGPTDAHSQDTSAPPDAAEDVVIAPPDAGAPADPPWCTAGTLDVECVDDDPCTLDFCLDGYSCVNVPFGIGGSCPCIHDYQCDDGDNCNADACLGGWCHHEEGNICDDGDACTVETCDQTFGCAYEPKACSDGDPCTTDTCSGPGTCEHTPIVDGADCYPCVTHADCDDELMCTSDSCQSGGCIHKSLCDDGDPCTLDKCHPVGGVCLHKDVCECVAHSECPDDGINVCFVGACVGGGCTLVKKKCDDENPCTEDFCEPESGCVAIPKSCDAPPDPCADSACDVATGECAIVPKSCDDADLCTLDLLTPDCDCNHVVLTCGDGDPCTDDVCEKASGCNFVLKDCDDGDPCTIDLCDPDEPPPEPGVPADGCTYEPVHCLGAEVCAEGACVPP